MVWETGKGMTEISGGTDYYCISQNTTCNLLVHMTCHCIIVLQIHIWLPGHTVLLCIIACTCPLVDTMLHICMIFVHATWFHFVYSPSCFLTTLNLHVQILKREMKLTFHGGSGFHCGVDGSAVDHSRSIFFWPTREFPFGSSWASFYIFLPVNHIFAPLGDIILM